MERPAVRHGGVNCDEEWESSTVYSDDHGVRQRPCAECPWRRDAPTGRFPVSAFVAQRGTSVQPDAATWDGQQAMFGCHMAWERGEAATCAGFLGAVGLRENWTVRLRAARGQIPPDVLQPDETWPELYDDYDEMAHANGAPAPSPQEKW